MRQSPPTHNEEWSNLDTNDGKLSITTTRIHCLTTAGLTLEMIRAYFICR